MPPPMTTVPWFVYCTEPARLQGCGMPPSPPPDDELEVVVLAVVVLDVVVLVVLDVVVLDVVVLDVVVLDVVVPDDVDMFVNPVLFGPVEQAKKRSPGRNSKN